MIRIVSIQRMAPLRRYLSADVYVWLKAILLVLIAIQLAKLFWVLITPLGPFNDWRPAPPRMISAEAQAALFSSVDPFYRPGAMETSQAEAIPELGLELFGVRESQGRIPGSAILGTTDGEQRNYMVGEEVAPGVKLSAVFFDHVVLARGSSEQKLVMPGSEEGQASGSSSAARQASGAAAAISAAFNLKPRRQGNGVTGAIVTQGRDAALFNSAGFRNGDVIVAVNGARITSMIDVQQLQSSVAPGARLMLSVERGAEVVPIALNLPGNP